VSPVVLARYLLAAGNESKQPQIPVMMLWVGMERQTWECFVGDHDRDYLIIVERGDVRRRG
jgi:hypothetical protein